MFSGESQERIYGVFYQRARSYKVYSGICKHFQKSKTISQSLSLDRIGPMIVASFKFPKSWVAFRVVAVFLLQPTILLPLSILPIIRPNN